jgi:GH43 family beta-xylosidase
MIARGPCALLVLTWLGTACGDGAPARIDATETGAEATSEDDDGDDSPGEASSGASTDADSDPDLDTGSADDDTTGPAPLPPVPGLWAEYFAGYHDPVVGRVEPGIDAIWALEPPDPALGADRFSIRWSGTLTAPATETFTIITENDDGIRVWIDDALVIDDWNPHFVVRNEAQVALTAGMEVPIVVEYFEIDIDAQARLLWSSPSVPEEVVPVAALMTVPESPELESPKPPYHNPVVGFDCPDPGVIAVPDAADPGYYMVCTGGSFPIRYSRDLVFWEDTGAAVLPAGKPAWADNGFRNWAPELHRVGDRFIAYFTSVNAANVLCIGAAVADEITGPYTETAGPLVEHPQGVIDATYFESGGVPWLFYKIDGNSVGQPTPIFVRELAADGLSFAPGSVETQVLTNQSGTWEGGVVEAPWVIERDGTFYMFYSGNVYDHRYRTGVARATSITGPWEKHGAPILANNERWVGPGHGTVLVVDGIDYFFFHAWTNAGDGTNLAGPGRHGLVDRIDWVDGWPQIHDGSASRSWQPWPGDG